MRVKRADSFVHLYDPIRRTLLASRKKKKKKKKKNLTLRIYTLYSAYIMYTSSAKTRADGDGGWCWPWIGSLIPSKRTLFHRSAALRREIYACDSLASRKSKRRRERKRDKTGKWEEKGNSKSLSLSLALETDKTEKTDKTDKTENIAMMWKQKRSMRYIRVRFVGCWMSMPETIPRSKISQLRRVLDLVKELNYLNNINWNNISIKLLLELLCVLW